MDLNALKEIIDANPELYRVFRGCPYEILNHWEIKEYQADTIICRQGEVIDCLYIIISGYVDVYYMAENGKKYSQIIIKRGELIGEFEIFDQKPLICSVEALTDIKTLQLKQTHFFKWLELDNNISSYLVKYLCNQFYLFSEKAGNDALYSLKARLCSYLLSQSHLVNKNTGYIELKLDKEKLSEKFAVTIRSVNRILQSLKSQNIIDIKTNSIIIKDFKLLTLEEEASRYD
ncbi:MAG: Crp/Fnr family transcriptional regulator [Firmicutes bacterium]|nr:Crp/Fnr family transcriptional regulator [Bacillota bacterium]